MNEDPKINEVKKLLFSKVMVEALKVIAVFSRLPLKALNQILAEDPEFVQKLKQHSIDSLSVDSLKEIVALSLEYQTRLNELGTKYMDKFQSFIQNG